MGAAREWIIDQFKSYSPRLQVSVDTLQIPNGDRVWKLVELRNGVLKDTPIPPVRPRSEGKWAPRDTRAPRRRTSSRHRSAGRRGD